MLIPNSPCINLLVHSILALCRYRKFKHMYLLPLQELRIEECQEMFIFVSSIWKGKELYCSQTYFEKTQVTLCTGAFLYVHYSFLLISNKLCDLSLLHWVGGRGVAVRWEIFTALHSFTNIAVKTVYCTGDWFKSPSHQIRSAWRWYGWTVSPGYKKIVDGKQNLKLASIF